MGVRAVGRCIILDLFCRVLGRLVVAVICTVSFSREVSFLYVPPYSSVGRDIVQLRSLAKFVFCYLA
jgi:hypothetical protein